MLGHPIIVNEQYVALSYDDVLARWKPRSGADFITIAHPAPGTPEPDLTPVANFGGYPLAKTSSGLFLADDQISPFVSLFTDTRTPRWHMDIMNRLGVPAVANDLVYTNAGGDNALDGIVALNPASGEIAWQFAPNGYVTEPVGIIDRISRREADPIEKALLKLKGEEIKKTTGRSVEIPTTITSTQASPMINAPHGHWLNPGLVTTHNRVYGQVGKQVVALQQGDGKQVWQWDLQSGETVRSIAADKSHLFISLDRRLVVLDLESGKEEFVKQTPRGGILTIASGMVFLAMGTLDPAAKDGGILMAFETSKPEDAPAEPAPVPPPAR